MDLQLKQWRNQLQDDDESEHQQSVDRIPKLLFDQSQTQTRTDSSAVLPLFSSEPTSKVDCLSGFSQDSPSKFTRMGSYFSSAQWQELELQALIYRYMLAGAVVPPELLQPIKKSLLHSSSYLLQHYSPYQPAWYWGKPAMDPEPGRCRRTDGKKWRCSRDVVAGRKYCERHMNRGRNRSRKPVEIPTLNNSNSSSNTNTNTNSSLGGSNFTVAGGFRQQPDDVPGNGSSFLFPSSSHSSDLLRLSHCSEVGNNNKSDGHILRHFFADWPKPSQDPETSVNASGRTSSSAMSLSISMPGNPSSASDVSLKLSTSNNNNNQEEETKKRQHQQQHQQQLNIHWMGTHQMGGPLAEALRSSTSSSPTSVLHHQLTRGGV